MFLKDECHEFLTLLENTRNKITKDTLNYRIRNLKKAKKFFQTYLEHFPNIDHEFSTLENQILKSEILNYNNSLRNCIIVLKNEEKNMQHFKIKDSKI